MGLLTLQKNDHISNRFYSYIQTQRCMLHFQTPIASDIDSTSRSLSFCCIGLKWNKIVSRKERCWQETNMLFVAFVVFKMNSNYTLWVWNVIFLKAFYFRFVPLNSIRHEFMNIAEDEFWSRFSEALIHFFLLKTII